VIMGMRTLRRVIMCAIEMWFALRFRHWRSKASLQGHSQSTSTTMHKRPTLAARAPSRDGESVLIGAFAGGSGRERGFRGRSCDINLLKLQFISTQMRTYR
jgi:hypothetical protein